MMEFGEAWNSLFGRPAPVEVAAQVPPGREERVVRARIAAALDDAEPSDRRRLDDELEAHVAEMVRVIVEHRVIECACDECTEKRIGSDTHWNDDERCPSCDEYAVELDDTRVCLTHEAPHIRWSGRIETGQPGVANWEVGTSADGRAWRREDRGGHWAVYEVES